jgi:hypothetical protein
MTLKINFSSIFYGQRSSLNGFVFIDYILPVRNWPGGQISVTISGIRKGVETIPFSPGILLGRFESGAPPFNKRES